MPPVITRQEAIARGLNKYFTGVPCKRGHICERYTQMSSCLQCLHPKSENGRTTREARLAVLLERQALQVRKRDRIFARGRMGRLKFTIHTPDLRVIRDFIYALAVAREPSLLKEDIYTKFQPRFMGGNNYQHAFRVFDQDFLAVQEMNLTLNRLRGIPYRGDEPDVPPLTPDSIAQARIDRLTAVLREANAQADRNWPEENYN